MSELAKAKEAVKEASERGKSKRTEYRRKQKEAQRASNMQVIWAPQYKEDGTPGPQVALVTCPVPEILFGGARGGGKLQPLSSPVCTPFGFVPIGNLSVGDQVTDPTTGGSCRIVAIHPQGVLPIYRVTFDDGASTLVGEEHLWAYKLPNHHRPRTKESDQREYATSVLGAVMPDERWNTLTVGPTKDLKAALDAGYRPRVPLTEPVLFTRNGRTGVTLDPYLLGLLIGDGHHKSMTITNIDPEIIEYLKGLGFEPDASSLHSTGVYKSWRPKIKTTAIYKPLQMWLINHGLNKCRSYEKFLPGYVQTAAIQYRHAFLQGLMDTDGYVDERGRCYYTTTSERLAKDVQKLVWGLGGKAYINTKNPTYTYKGDLLDGRLAYELLIQIPKSSELFRLSRKKARCTDSWNGGYEMMRAVESIEYVGDEEAVCIQVSSPYGLYLTDNYIVTHNTDGALGAWLIHANTYGQHAKGIFFRRRFKQLEQVQERCSVLFPKLGAVFNKGEAIWVFPNGATLKLRHLWDEFSCEEYQGHAYSYMVFEELTNWPTPAPLNKMRGTLRSAHGVKTQIICTANPGGSGHNWVRQRYINPAPKGYTPIVDPESGETRIFIPSRLEDNLAMMKNDPNYERRLLQSGNAALVKAWRWGDWNIVSGGFFDDIFDPDKHLVTPFAIPSGWRYRRSFDWGSAAPASLGIWAISDGTPVQEMDGFVFPRGSLVRIDEWYTVATDASGNIRPNEGLRLTNLALGAGIGHRSQGRNFSGCVADPAIFSQHGRQSIFSEMQIGARETGHHLLFNMADNNRVAGWQKVRDMLENAAQDHPEKPGLWAFETCTNYARTLPVAQRDEQKPDDVDTDGEDHVIDDVRYCAMTGGRGVVEGSFTGH